MKQVYIESYYGNGYRRFMQYFNDVFEHPQKDAIEKRLEIIKFFDDYGAEATKRAFGKSRSTVFIWKRKLKILAVSYLPWLRVIRLPSVKEEGLFPLLSWILS